MALKLTATFVGANNKPLDGLEVSAGYLSAGRYVNLVTGVTTAAGQFTQAVGIPADLPQLVLRVKKGNAWVKLDAVPSTYNARTANFGTVSYGEPLLVPAVPARGGVAIAVNVDDLNRKINDLNVQKQKLELETSTLKNDLVKIQENYTSAVNQTNLFKERNAALTSEISKVKADLINTRKQNDILLRKVADTEKALEEKDKTIAQLNETIAGSRPAEMKVDEVCLNSMMQLKSAQAKINSAETGFALGKISMNLKVLPGATGDSVKFPDADTIKAIGSASLSDLRIEFENWRPRAPAKVPGQGIIVPALIGMTQTLAIRKLRQLGFDYALREEYVGSGATAQQRHGCVIWQDPPAGASLTVDTVLSLTIGKSA